MPTSFKLFVNSVLKVSFFITESIGFIASPFIILFPKLISTLPPIFKSFFSHTSFESKISFVFFGNSPSNKYENSCIFIAS